MVALGLIAPGRSRPRFGEQVADAAPAGSAPALYSLYRLLGITARCPYVVRHRRDRRLTRACDAGLREGPRPALIDGTVWLICWMSRSA